MPDSKTELRQDNKLLPISCSKPFAISNVSMETAEQNMLRNYMKSSLRRMAALLAFSVLSVTAAVSGHTTEVGSAEKNGSNHRADADTISCNNTGTQAELEQCATQALNQADAELSQTYVDYRNQLDRRQQDKIRDVQLAWIKYRDLSCKYASINVSGPAHALSLQTCLTEKTKERTREIKALASCSEGELNCPH